MAFAFIRPSSLSLVEAANAETGSPADADAAADALREDYERWSRWWCGLGAYTGAVVGANLCGIAVEFVRFPAASTTEVGLGGAFGLVSLGLAVACAVLLFRLWRTGRALTGAASWWLRLPYRAAGRQRRASGWLEARTVNFEPPLFARITTSALAFLFGLFGLSVLFAPTAIQDMPGFASGLGGAGLLSLVCAWCQLGGVTRVVSGVGERDPLWVRLRGGG